MEESLKRDELERELGLWVLKFQDLKKEKENLELKIAELNSIIASKDDIIREKQVQIERLKDELETTRNQIKQFEKEWKMKTFKLNAKYRNKFIYFKEHQDRLIETIEKLKTTLLDRLTYFHQERIAILQILNERIIEEMNEFQYEKKQLLEREFQKITRDLYNQKLHVPTTMEEIKEFLETGDLD
ncbi:MAG: hypothetical protein ACXQS8_00675 [Candidatus Helarchaeales archaeon]